MASNARVVVDFVANTKDLSAGVAETANATDKAGGRLGKFGKAAVRTAGALGIGALVAGLKMGADEFSEAAKVGAQTEAVIKSTGGAAKVTASHVGDLAGDLLSVSGVDDELIQKGANVLLTFKNIRNEVGKGNNVFDQATAATLDMSVALGQDMKSSSVLVGKALNDPIKGLSALQRVGITFTKAQKKQIDSMVKSGNVMGAQKVILGELESQFGGSAKAAGQTLPGQLAILNQELSNVLGGIVGSLIGPLQTVAGFFTKYPGLIKPIVLGVAALAVGLVALNVVMAISAAVSAGMLAPFLIVVGVLAAVVVAVALAVKHWDKIKGAMQGVWDWVRSNWPKILVMLTGPIGLAVVAIARNWDAIVSGVRTAWNTIVSFLGGVGSRIAAAFATVRTWLLRPIEWARDAADAVRAAWNGTMTFLTNLGGRIGAAFGAVRSWLTKPGEWARDAASAVDRAFDALVGTVRGLAGRVAGPIQAVASAIKGPLNAVLSAWNRTGIPSFSMTIPMPGPVPDIKFGFGGATLPDIPLLAAGGVIDAPTLAVVGEGRGREIVTPEALMREIVAEGAPEVRVYIGETELRSMVRYEVRRAGMAQAATILGGVA